MADTPHTHEHKFEFPFWKEFLTELAGMQAVGIGKWLIRAGIGTLTSILSSFTKQTGEKVSERAAKVIAFSIFGPNEEDERQFNAARLLLSDNERILLSKKLGTLTPRQSDYYRLTAMQAVWKDDVCQIPDLAAATAKTADVLRMHALMSDEEWTRECGIMNLHRKEDETTFKKFLKWCDASFRETLDNDTKRLEAELAERRARLTTKRPWF
jgi:hypothetical protein